MVFTDLLECVFFVSRRLFVVPADSLRVQGSSS